MPSAYSRAPRVRSRQPGSRLASARCTVKTRTSADAGSGCASGAISSSSAALTPSRRCCSARSAASSVTGIERAMRPFTITSTVSATAMATPRFCSISSTAISPSATSDFSIASTCCTITGARPSVGSSITSSRGLSSSARAIASICCSPPESSAPPFDLRSARRGNVAVGALDGPRALARSRRQPEMLVHGQRRPDPAPLRHVADAEPRDPVRRQPDQLLAQEADAARRAHQARDRVAERGLAHAVSAHHGKHAPLQRQRHLLQRVRAAVVDVQLLDREHGTGLRPALMRAPPGPCRSPALPDRSRSRPACLP